MEVLRENARELEYEITVDKFNNYVTNMQINDAQEDAKLTAQMSRMEAGASAAAMRAQGTASLISSFGQAAKIGYNSNFQRLSSGVQPHEDTDIHSRIANDFGSPRSQLSD